MRGCDPRDRRGVRHRLVTVLAAGVCAVLAGARSYLAIAERAHDLPASVRVRLEISRRAASESTSRSILHTVDTHASGVVLGRTEVDDKSNEITAFAPLLDRIDRTDTVITADALHTQDRHATYLHERGGHCVFIVKNNRPKLRAPLAGLPWRDIPTVEPRQDKRHSRVKARTLKLTAIDSGILFPHAQLAVQRGRRTPYLRVGVDTARLTGLGGRVGVPHVHEPGPRRQEPPASGVTLTFQQDKVSGHAGRLEVGQDQVAFLGLLAPRPGERGDRAGEDDPVIRCVLG